MFHFGSHLGVLLVLEVLVDRGVEVLGVAFVQTVDLSLLLDLHVPLSQDELAYGLRNKNTMFNSDNQGKQQEWIYLTLTQQQRNSNDESWLNLIKERFLKHFKR